MRRVRLATFALVLWCAGATSLPVRADSTADAVMAKVRAYLGWTLGDGHIGTIRIKGRISQQSTFDEICEPERFVQYDTGVDSGRPFMVTSGQGYARVSHAGAARELPGDVGADAFTQSLLLCNAFAAYPATMVADIDVSQTALAGDTAIVALHIPSEPAVLLAVRPESGEITSVVVDGIATYVPAGLKSVDGTRKMYTVWKRKVSEVATSDMLVSSLQLNVAVDESIFTPKAIDVAPPPDPALLINF
jgi:hypothetical protein